MPYTIHLAESEDEVLRDDPDLSFEYPLHQRIFDTSQVELHDLHLFYNLADYYQDAVYLQSHVIGLRGEVEEARKRIHDPRATEALSHLAKVCERAVRKQLSIFAYGE